LRGADHAGGGATDQRREARHFGAKPVGPHDARHEPQALGFLRLHDAAGETQLSSDATPDHVVQRAVDDVAELDLRMREARGIGGDPQVGHDREVEAAGEGGGGYTWAATGRGTEERGRGTSVAGNGSLEAHSRSDRSGCWNSLRSKPELKTSPAPVITTVFTASSQATASRASDTSSRSAIDNAFFLSGRLRVKVTTPSSGADRSSSAPLTSVPDADGDSLTSRQVERR